MFELVSFCRRHAAPPAARHRRLLLERLETRAVLAFDPSAQAQELLEHINRMRLDPQGELDVLFSSLNPLVARDPGANSAIRFFNDPTAAEIASEWPTLTPAPPLAWHEALLNSAAAHTALMIQFDSQSHQLPGEAGLGARIEAAGYDNWGSVGENIFAYADNVMNAHAAFAIDWGVAGRGHRQNLMNPSYREVGIGIQLESNSATDVGPMVVTQDFGFRFDQDQAFVLGVVYQDANHNERYDAGEGIGGTHIELTGAAGTFSTTTLSAGGYQLFVPPGTYNATASGGGLAQPQLVSGVVIGADNVKVDFDGSATVPSPQIVQVTSPAANGTYAGGAVISLTVEFSEAVLVTGSPTLRLETGATDRLATYVSGSGGTALRFDYAVQAGDNSTDLDYASTSALQLAGGSIRSAAAADANLTLPALGAAGSLAANKNLKIDGVAPLVNAATPNLTTIKDANAGAATFKITLTYNEPMDTGVAPTIAFPTEDPGVSLVANAGASGWTNSVTYVAAFDVVDLDLSLAQIDLQASGGRDAAGNLASGALFANKFGLAMANPRVASIVPSATTVFDRMAGKGKFALTVNYAEPMDTSVKPTIEFPVESPASSLTLRSSQSRWLNPTTYVARYDVKDVGIELAQIDVRVLGARNAAGQTQTVETTADKFHVDTRNPTAQRVVPSATLLADAHVGVGQFSLRVEFSEPMNTSVLPRVGFPRERPGADLKWNVGQSGWLDSVTYVAVFDLVDRNKTVSQIDVEVAGGVDLAGNSQTTLKTLDVFSIDTANPAPRGVTANPRTVRPEHVGEAMFALQIVFSEAMNSARTPLVTFPVETFSDALRLNSAQSGWLNSTTYVARYDVAAVDLVLANIDLAVEGAEDLAGNASTRVVFKNKFGIEL